MSNDVTRRYYVARSPRLYRALADAIEAREALLQRRLDFCNELGAVGLLGYTNEPPTDVLYSASHQRQKVGFLPPHRLSEKDTADFTPKRPIPWVHTPDPAHPWGKALLDRLARLADVTLAQTVCRRMGTEQYVVMPEKTYQTGAIFSDAYMVFAVPFSTADPDAKRSMPPDLLEIPREIAKHLWRAADDDGDSFDD